MTGLPKNASRQVPEWRIKCWPHPTDRIPWRADQRRLDRIMEELWFHRAGLGDEDDDGPETWV